MDDDFLLSTDTAKDLFRAAKEMPVFDWHCHLSPKEIYDNKNPDDIAELWLSYDHYKWRAMRSFGIDEKYITGDADGYDKFKAWAKTMPYLIGIRFIIGLIWSFKDTSEFIKRCLPKRAMRYGKNATQKSKKAVFLRASL